MASFGLAPNSQAIEMTLLDHATILIDSAEPSFVQYGVEDLAGYLKESTGNEIPIGATPAGTPSVQIVVGAKTVRAIVPESSPDEKLGEEGYLVKAVAKNGVTYIVATGATARGTKAALGVLMKAIQVEGQSARVTASLNLTGRPALAKRGMHFNGWAFSYPYSFRSWREEDWHCYLDILAYQGVNLFFLWPFIEIMPVPLSPEDQAYLEECRRVVDYAQQKHGMEVWIMQCTNRMHESRGQGSL